MPSPIPGPTRDATQTRRGLMGILSQTFAGVKTFLDPICLARRAPTELPTGSEGMVLFNTVTKRALVHDGNSWLPVVMSTAGVDVTSLEEHILSLTAHSADHISWTGGSSQWADGTVYAPTHVEDAVLAAVELLAGTGGARKVGTDNGSLTGTNVQEQLDELAGTRAALIGDTFTGPVEAPTFIASGSSIPTAAITNSLNKANIPKSWGYVNTGSNPYIRDGFNIQSVTLNGTNAIRIRFAAPMSNADYSVTRFANYLTGKAVVSFRHTDYFDLSLWDDSISGYMNLSTQSVTFDFTVFGRQ